MKKDTRFFIGGGLLVLSLISFTFLQKEAKWKTLTPASEPELRSENAFVRVDNQFYLFGGRKKESMYVYNPASNEWRKLGVVPLEMHHFQAIAYKGEIYVLGAFTGDFPHETPIPNIYIYNPKKDQWRKGTEIPANRRRGAAGVTIYQNKIYLVNGITDGHWDGHVNWLDEYDPETGKWSILPDAPHVRDHVQAAVSGNQLFIAGGRRSTQKIGHVLDLTVPEVDIYDFTKKRWRTLPKEQNIPTQRAGCTSVTLGDQIVVIGGESPQKLAHNQTEAFDFKTQSWHALAPMQTGRHGTQALVYNQKIYIAAGSANQGGGPELNSLEVFE
ncbi:kelch repeat-containing protein [Cytophagaceae bacterium YF14B1]|uniref:Kelch repeat-containing protein n=1 Tax=Xanthocytophaga flava TaxID=3048013 RepID=A0AAE3QHN7_9BACT|nr:kelch repeat-containing protein [Xanthocytophaga flavus]MDJ1479562.1 kelch repeat-containing protein [Xanthocytophaga flavus]